MTNEYGQKDRWYVTETAWFQYHCYLDHDSGDAELWYRSHQQVEIISDSRNLYDPVPGWNTLAKRRAGGQPRCYQIRFADGFEDCAHEDELFIEKIFLDPDLGSPPGNEIIAARQKDLAETEKCRVFASKSGYSVRQQEDVWWCFVRPNGTLSYPYSKEKYAWRMASNDARKSKAGG